MVDGRFVALEGGEGSGKTTQAARLGKAINAVVTREPGGTHLGGLVRTLLLDPRNHMSPRTEALLLAADRAQHMAEIVIPTLTRGRQVVSDRSAYSSLAYQGFGRGLPLDELRNMNGWALQGRWPDVVILLDLDPAAATARLKRDPDRIEQADIEFHRRVRTGFLQMAAADPGRWTVVAGSDDEDTVAATIRDVVRQRLGL
jgi:dTMP kinase